MGELCSKGTKVWITIGVIIVSATAAFIRTESLAGSNKEKLDKLERRVEQKLETLNNKIFDNSTNIAVIKEKSIKTEQDVGKILEILQRRERNRN